MSAIVCKRSPLSIDFNFINKEKYHGARLGEYSGCGTTGV